MAASGNPGHAEQGQGPVTTSALIGTSSAILVDLLFKGNASAVATIAVVSQNTLQDLFPGNDLSIAWWQVALALLIITPIALIPNRPPNPQIAFSMGFGMLASMMTFVPPVGIASPDPAPAMTSGLTPAVASAPALGHTQAPTQAQASTVSFISSARAQPGPSGEELRVAITARLPEGVSQRGIAVNGWIHNTRTGQTFSLPRPRRATDGQALVYPPLTLERGLAGEGRPGALILRLEAPGFAIVNQKVEIPEGRSAAIEVTLTRSAVPLFVQRAYSRRDF